MKSKKNTKKKIDLKDLELSFDIDDNWDEAEKSRIETEKFRDNHLFANCLPLTDEDIFDNLGFLQSVIDEDVACKLEKKDYCPFNGYHLLAKRNSKTNLLVFYYSKCEKVRSQTLIKEKQKNYLYNSYAFNNDFKDIHSEKTTSISKNNFLKVFFEEWKSESKKGIYIYGKPGVGKTFLFKMLANKIITSKAEKDFKVALIFLPDMVEAIKESFSNDRSDNFKKIIYAANNADFVFFDDIGSEYASDWFYSNYFLVILNNRISNKKATFFNSNLSIDEYERKIISLLKSSDKKIAAKRITDRIKRLVGNNFLLIEDKNYASK
ncbi:MAG: AAA family ATPase [Malacoplasma sp.]|nr:AAA family ATPase [Malacoplasma sp.]MDE6893870.1 AAA family ATPase [Malacoplasma sp.]